MFKEMGVSYITLCHNGDNDICDSARGKQEWKGLSPFGKEVVKEMNRLGIMVDISHAAESTFYQVLEVSRRNHSLPLFRTCALRSSPQFNG